MRSVCDGPCRDWKKISKVIRYENSDQVKRICGPCDEAHRNQRNKQQKRTFRPHQRRAA